MRPGYTRVFLLLVICQAVAGVRGSAQGIPPAGSGNDNRKLQILDLNQIVRQVMSTESDKYDYSADIFNDNSASVHLHVLGYAQTTPLHLHHKSEEATFVVAGKPHVTQIFGSKGKAEKLEGDYTPGTMIYSPKLCGHKWVNTAKNVMQANLVISTPPFVGNFYVDQTEPLFRKSDPGLIVRLNDDLQRWMRDSQNPFLAEKLPMMNGWMLRLLLRKQVHLKPSSSPTMLYLVSGKGLLGAGQSYSISAQNVALIPPNYDITLDAGQNSPIAAIIFRPGTGWEALPTQ